MNKRSFKKVVKIGDNHILYNDNKFELFGNILDLGSYEMKYYDNLNGNIIGIDNQKTSNPKVLYGDLRRTSIWKIFESNYFDCITSFGLLHWLNNPNIAFSQMKRILKNNGRMFHVLWHEDNFQKDKVKILTDNKPIMENQMFKTNEKHLEKFLKESDFFNYEISIENFNSFKFIILIGHG